MSQLDDIAVRMAAIEERMANLTTSDLPIAALKKKLESDWHPDAGVLLQPKSIGAAQLEHAPIFGYISNTGVLVSGSQGFVVTRTSAGHYTVTFTPARKTVPAVGFAPQVVGSGTIMNLGATPTTASFTIIALNLGGTAFIDAAWSFVAF